ncbi:MAG TPA: condensation domain-containing protein, partial [Thermoanaerobaculia bacterium]
PTSVTEDDLKDFLRAALPDFMTPNAFVFLPRLPLTANGKIDRRALPAPDPTKRNARAVMTPPRNPTEQRLVEIWQKVLRLEQIGVHDNFFHLGGDSILAIQIVAQSNRAGLRLTPRQLFQHQTVAELAAVVGEKTEVASDQGPVRGAVPLTPIQSWFFEQDLPDSHHYNQSVLLESRHPLEVEALEETVQALLSHHDALRLRFRPTVDGWEQSNAEFDARGVFSKVSLGELEAPQIAAAIEEAAASVQASLDLASGPIARIVLLDCGSHQRSRLLFVVHHLAVDGVSWRILLEDFETAYSQRIEGRRIELPAKTTSFQSWAQRLVGHARSGAIDSEFAYWLPLGTREFHPLPRDFSGVANTVRSESAVTMSLSAQETGALLQSVPAAYGTQINDALLTALLQAVSAWTGQRSLLVDLEGHGREEILDGVDLSRTVGWFTARFPQWISTEDPSDSVETLKQIKEQLRAVPNRGIGYGLLRYGGVRTERTAALAAFPQPEISFNYLGQLDSSLREGSAFAAAAEGGGPTRSSKQKRRHLLSVDGGIRGGRLRFVWTYSEAVHRRETVEGIASRFADSLRALVARCISPDAGGYTPSDFPKAKLDQKALDKLVSRLQS